MPTPPFTTPVWLPFNTSSLGDNIIIQGAQATPTIQILAIYIQCGTVTTMTIKAGSNSLTGSMVFATGGSFQLVNVNSPYFECTNGDSLIINLSGLTGSAGGTLLYNQF